MRSTRSSPTAFTPHRAAPRLFSGSDPAIPIAGRRPVEELLRKGIRPEKLLVQVREQAWKQEALLEPFRRAGWKIEEKEKADLDAAAEGLHHQGFVALLTQFPYIGLEALRAGAQALSPEPTIVVLDQIQDAGNLGAILRSAECAGAAGAIIPLHRAAGITPAVIRASAGAALHLPIARVVNLSPAIDELKLAGFRVFGADQEGSKSIYEADLRGPAVLVVGSEGRGLRPGIKRRCDQLLALPLCGKVTSLNASVAAALCLYEILRQNLKTR